MKSQSVILFLCACLSACSQDPLDHDKDGHEASVDCNDNDSRVWQMLSFQYRDQDEDGYWISESGNICAGASLPTGYSNSSDKEDCDDHDPDAWLVHLGFLDEDGDGYGAGDQISVCSGKDLPAGYTLVGQDCRPNDPNRWQMLEYAYLDEDSDGYTVPVSGSVCSGAHLAPPYFAQEQGKDCDDSNPEVFQLVGIYIDLDGDGVGAGPIQEFCSGLDLPDGYSETGSDCDDNNQAAWQMLSYSFKDLDQDGHTIPSAGGLCTGSQLPTGYQNSSNGHDCDDDDQTVWQVLPYSFKDLDQDGHTIPSAGELCAGTKLPIGYQDSSHGHDCDDSNASVWEEIRVFADVDEDGFGFGQQLTICSNGQVPPKHALQAGDCDPENGAQWQLLAFSYRDEDLDGFTVDQQGTICSGNALPSGYLETGSPIVDCNDHNEAVWQELSYTFVDHDTDGYTISASGTLCAGDNLPEGFSNTHNGDDCDDSDPSVWEQQLAYADLDQDGYGAGEQQTLCTNGEIPSDYSSIAQDCAPTDNTKWVLLPYSYRDVDGDGYTIAQQGTVCSGDNLPDGYKTDASPTDDCDDTDPTVFQTSVVYGDADGDNVGYGESSSLCIGSDLPEGFALSNNDCDDSNNEIWQEISYEFRDQDLDGYTIHSPGIACAGDTLPSGYANSQNGNDCDDTNPSVWHSVELYQDLDFDGVGAGDSLAVCIGEEIPEGFAQTKGDCAPDDGSKWQNLEYYYRDADGDTYTVPEEGTVCSASDLPAGYYVLPQNDDCDDQNASVFTSTLAYIDSDGDGYGSEVEEIICIGNELPAGYSDNNTDCDVDDGNYWQWGLYKYVDADSDNHTIEQEGQVCSGQYLPPGYYYYFNHGNDCDDSNPNVFIELVGYFDEDGDQIGAGEGETFCTDGYLPYNYYHQGNDCAPEDPEKWKGIVYYHVDLDFDGYSKPEFGIRCSGESLDEGYYQHALSEFEDCNDQDELLFRIRPLFVDQDGDGVGTLPYHMECIGDEVPEGFSLYGDDSDDNDPDIQFDEEDEEFWLIVFG